MYATAIVGGKVVKFLLPPALAKAHQRNAGHTMTDQEAVDFVEVKRRRRALRRAKPHLDGRSWHLLRHEPDNRFVECALAIDADYLVTVNTARGHFDKAAYGRTRVLTPGAFLNRPDVQRLLRQLWTAAA